MESGFICIIHTGHAILPPEALQRRDDVFKKSIDLAAGLVAHFQGVGNCIQNADGALISAALLVGVAAALHRDVVCCRNGYDLRLVLG